MRTRTIVLLLVAMLVVLPLVADEGMWLFNHPPRQILKQRYGFDPSQAWLDHLQKSSVRFNSGGSGSFVSPDGLVLTNHHVGLDCLQKISTAKHDYIATGFHAKKHADEVKCVDLELNVLMSIEDVTQRVNAAVTTGMSAADAQAARRAIMNTIEQESLSRTGLRSDVVTLYQGGEYQLYRYKKYTDVRLVFAPEVTIAFFGGDPDNFEYPRYDLDICLFRAYENGKPVHVDNYLRFDPAGVKDGDLILVSGHPGRTDRLRTLADLQFLRDVQYPSTQRRLFRREVLLRAYSERSFENERRAHDELFGIENSRKAYRGFLAGLQDPVIMKMKSDAEAALRQKVAADPQLQARDGDAWHSVETAVDAERSLFLPYTYLELGSAFNSRLFTIARQLVRMAEERAKPNSERLREYRESNLESLQQELYSEAPIYPDLETIKLADSLSDWLTATSGGPAEDPLVAQVLDGKSPNERAAELIRGTKLIDVAYRKQLGEGGLAAINASSDPMIRLARLVDPRAREIRKRFEDTVDEPQRQAYAKIADAVFRTGGGETYPDATFTLRLSFGTVKGFVDDSGAQIPWHTTIKGAFARAAEHKNQPPFDLPKSWLAANPKLRLDTPLDFINTADIIGGNSGSPVVNRDGKFVGIVFDMNLQSLPWDYAYDDRQGRCVAVDVRAILEALKKVYGVTDLVSELTK